MSGVCHQCHKWHEWNGKCHQNDLEGLLFGNEQCHHHQFGVNNVINNNLSLSA